MNKGFDRVARFYGVDESEIIRRQGLLENNLQNFRDLMSDVVLEKIMERPDLLKHSVRQGLITLLNS